MLQTGQILEGKYRIENKIDEGGMGQVYKVRHLTLDRSFALKVLRPLSTIPAEQKAYVEQFELEARILAALDHPGLAKVVDLFHDDTTSFLVMELVEGMTLTRMLEDAVSPLSQEAVKKLADQALDVLEYLHGSDPPVIVRDIKPDNLMVTSDGRLKLIDFGLAKTFVEGQDTQTIVRGMGTDCYAPMEQYGEGSTDGRTDLFALGASLYFALTGEPPPPVWRRASMQQALPHPGEKNPTVTEDFWNGLKALMEIDMRGRPSDAAEARIRLTLAPTSSDAPTRGTTPLVVAHGVDYRLASAQEFYPFGPGDWILKVMQAASLAQAREVRVTQTRSVCRVTLGIPAHGLPEAGAILDALTGQRDPGLPWLDELAYGLRMVGEFRDFSLLLDNWRRAWKVEGRGGKLEAFPVKSEGKAGLLLEVAYVGKGVDRARQAADEMVGLVRRTRLCPFPLYIDDRRANWERSTERPLFKGQVREVYLASVSLPPDGQIQHQRAAERPEILGDDEALARFAPPDGRPSDAHLDLRVYLEPTLSKASTLAGFTYLRQPMRLLWYRHGVLCGEQTVEGWHSLEITAHCEGSHLPANESGLSITPGEVRFPMHLRAMTRLPEILPVIQSELEAYEPPKPAQSSSVGKAAAGIVAGPLLVLLFGAAAGPIVMKSALAMGALQKAAALGGVAGYLYYDREEEMLRNACIKALNAFQPAQS